MLSWLLALGVCATLPLRRRYPVAVVVITGVAALVVPGDALAVLVALPSVIARRPPRTGWWCGALAAAGTAAALARDAALRPDHAVFSVTDQATGDVQVLSSVAYVVLGAVFVTVSVGWGLLRCSREATDAATRVQQQQAVAVQELRAELTTELSRQDERDLIARELHDTVAHHLSVVSLRASALEVSAPAPEVQDAARSVRSSAHEALEEMRDLIAVLRDGQVSLTPGPAITRTLAELPELVASVREGGADVVATVFVSDGGRAPAALTRAVYRIVQESLTNALKHAPDARVDLDVRAAPGDGVHLRVRNPLAGPSGTGAPGSGTGTPGSGTGLVGMRERAATVGGTVVAGPRTGPEGALWLVEAHLPWPAAAQGGSTIGG